MGRMTPRIDRRSILAPPERFFWARRLTASAPVGAAVGAVRGRICGAGSRALWPLCFGGACGMGVDCFP